MVLWDKRLFGKYSRMRAAGKIDKDAITEDEYEWANLSPPDGQHPTRIWIGGRRDYLP